MTLALSLRCLDGVDIPKKMRDFASRNYGYHDENRITSAQEVSEYSVISSSDY